MSSDMSPLGCIGVLTIGTRGPGGAGEVQLKIRGGSEAYLAWSTEPLVAGTTVLVVESHGTRTVSVVPWSDLDLPSSCTQVTD